VFRSSTRLSSLLLIRFADILSRRPALFMAKLNRFRDNCLNVPTQTGQRIEPDRVH
jgi:hypothetical protein